MCRIPDPKSTSSSSDAYVVGCHRMHSVPRMLMRVRSLSQANVARALHRDTHATHHVGLGNLISGPGRSTRPKLTTRSPSDHSHTHLALNLVYTTVPASAGPPTSPPPPHRLSENSLNAQSNQHPSSPPRHVGTWAVSSLPSPSPQHPRTQVMSWGSESFLARGGMAGAEGWGGGSKDLCFASQSFAMPDYA